MSGLNFKHLRYFWAVAANGSIARASEILHLTPQTISGQLRELEEQLGAKLFQKSGRNLVLTDTGRVVFSYADEMFRLGDELQDVLEGRIPGATLKLTVGVAMVVPKLLAYRVLEPVLRLQDPVHLVCQEAPLADLLADLSVHKLDLVLADSPISPALNIRAYNHPLGEWDGQYLGFEVDVSTYLNRLGENVLTAVVDNCHRRCVLPGIKDPDFFTSGSKRCGQIHRDRAFSNTALAAQHHEFFPD